MRILASLVSLFVIFSTVVDVRAETIEFPEEELATESVLPVFDKTVVVRNRAITTAGRLEFGAAVGLSLIEALYDNMLFGFNGAYHFDETRGMQFQLLMQSDGLSNNGQKLKDGVFDGVNFDASMAPSPEMYLLGNYQLTAYYGKISVTKSTSLNLSLFGLLGMGVVKFTDGVSEPALNAGFGQKFYINENLAIRFDLGLTMFQGPDPTSRQNLTGGGQLTSDDFDSTLYFRSFLTAGLVYLL